MKIIGFAIFIFAFLSFETPLENVRNQFPNIESLEQANKYISILKDEISPEARGYMATMILMKSRFVKNPFSKLKYFKRGKKLLDNDIAENSKNIEIRYLRFLMQKQIPDFLGYNKNMNEDFNYISKNLLASSLKKSFKIELLNNMLSVDNLNVTEKNKINEILNRI